MQIEQLKKSIFVNIIAIYTYIFIALYLLSKIPLKSFYIFYEIFNFLLLNFWLICPILILIAITESLYNKIRTKSYLKTKFFDNKFYSFFFWLGLILFIIFGILYYWIFFGFLTIDLPD